MASIGSQKDQAKFLHLFEAVTNSTTHRFGANSMFLLKDGDLKIIERTHQCNIPHWSPLCSMVKIVSFV